MLFAGRERSTNPFSMAQLTTESYNYELPEELVAQKPLSQRDTSRLLVYTGGKIRHMQFSDIVDQLPENANLYFNNAKVIPARTYFKRETGANIEIFILHPSEGQDVQQVLQQKHESSWECLIRNLKKWQDHEAIYCQVTIESENVKVAAELTDRSKMLVKFTWDTEHSFSEVLEAMGKIPLPPYIKRESDESDKETYQTVYAEKEGAVAAPTAGLHFTERIQEELVAKGIGINYLTLHVGAGTFKPVTTEYIDDHDMHAESFEVTIPLLKSLMESRPRIAVGTTSLRSLESLYWVGVQIINKRKEPFYVHQFIHQEDWPLLPSYKESIRAVLDYMIANNLKEKMASTAIMIYPGVKIRSIDGLITNFHLPKSTLIALVAAFIGEDWKKVYREAVDERYRFLSYGDSSLLLP